MCQCGNVSRIFPMAKEDEERHEDSDKPSGPRCNLIKLANFVAEAKYETTGASTAQRRMAKRPTSLREFEKSVKETNDRAAEGKTPSKFGNAMNRSTSSRRFSGVPGSPLANNSGDFSRRLSTTTSATSVSVDESYADENVPVLFKNYARKRPFAKVNMALRVGPLLIQNGTTKYVSPKSNAGGRFSIADVVTGAATAH